MNKRLKIKLKSIIAIFCSLLIIVGLNSSTTYAQETVPGVLTDVKAIDAGYRHSLVLKNDGTVWAWGRNDYGQLGDGTTNDSCIPVQVEGLTEVQAISSTCYNSVALKNDGTVWAWGSNSQGELGDGTTNISYKPVQVQGLTDVQVIIGGKAHFTALKNDGTVWAWGSNSQGELGDGTTNDSCIPVQVEGLIDVQAIEGSNTHCIALRNDGTVWTWGHNAWGQLGDGTTNNIRCIPVQVKDLTDVEAIGVGAYHSLALKNDGTVWTWGHNAQGQLGNGTTSNSCKPVQVQGLTDVKVISGGNLQSLALKNDGTVWAWGSNSHGQLGDGTTNNRCKPVQVQELTDVESISKGECQSLALKSDGTVWAWGHNAWGQLGDGTTNDSSKPVQVIDTTQKPKEPNQPQNLTASAGDSQIVLSWNQVEDVEKYIVKRAISEEGPFEIIVDNVTVTTYIDNNIEPGVTYYYVVRAVKNGVESKDSNVASAMVKENNNRALLLIKLLDENDKEYDLSKNEVDTFMNWYFDRGEEKGSAYYTFKKNFNVGPYISRKDYISYDKIICIEVNEYIEQ